MNIDPALLVTLFVLVALTIPAAIGSVIVYRGTYYKSLPAKVEALEKDNSSKDEVNKRQAKEIRTLTDMVTGKAELKEIIQVLKNHDEEAERRHETSVRLSDEQHSVILANIEAIKKNQNRRTT